MLFSFSQFSLIRIYVGEQKNSTSFCYRIDISLMTVLIKKVTNLEFNFFIGHVARSSCSTELCFWKTFLGEKNVAKYSKGFARMIENIMGGRSINKVFQFPP